MAEGDYRILDHFEVSRYTDQYQATELVYRIFFVSSTVVIPCDAFSSSLPEKYLVKIQDVLANNFNHSILFDVVGLITGVGRYYEVVFNGGIISRVSIEISDPSGAKIRCVLWGRVADHVYRRFDCFPSQGLLCLVRLMSIEDVGGQVVVPNSCVWSNIVFGSLYPSPLSALAMSLTPATMHHTINIVDLPKELLHLILLALGQGSFRDLCCARAVCKMFRGVSNDPFYFKKIDLFGMEFPRFSLESVVSFKTACLRSGNMSALFLRGSCEYFRRGNIDDGLNMIRAAARGGYDLARYVYSNIQRIVTPDVDVDADLVILERSFLTDMRKKVRSVGFNGWFYEPPEMFSYYADLIPVGDLYKCDCTPYYPWFEPSSESFKSPDMCDSCFFTIHSYAFVDEFVERVEEWPQ